MSDPQGQRSVYALDNVRLELPVATAGSRTLSALLDYTLLSLVITMVLFAGIFAAVTLGIFEGASAAWIVTAIILSLFFVEFGFFISQELALGGQTLGKRILGLRVVSNRGGRASAIAIVLRNLVRSIDLLFGMWFLMFDPRGRRLGDRLGGTMVVHELPPVSSGNAVARAPSGWGPERISVVEALLERLERLSPDEANTLSRRILRLANHDDSSFPYHQTGVSPSTLLMQAFSASASPTVATTPTASPSASASPVAAAQAPPAPVPAISEPAAQSTSGAPTTEARQQSPPPPFDGQPEIPASETPTVEQPAPPPAQAPPPPPAGDK